MANKLNMLVIKPTLSCNANCPTCSLRKTLFKTKKKDREVGLNQWKDLFKEAKQLGCENLHISGGEPLLYNELVQLITEGKNQKMYVNLNTNGGLITSEFAERISKSGLDDITVSIYSSKANINDKYRACKGLFAKATEGIKILRSKNTSLINCQTILAEYNLLELDELIGMAFDLKIGYLYISYIEGDVDKVYTPALGQIKKFKETTVAEILKIFDRFSPQEYKEEAKRTVKKIFTNNNERNKAFSEGQYFQGLLPDCQRPDTFALVLSNGDVLPCNGVEYSHEPIVGNIHNNSFKQIWESDSWNNFRQKRHAWCYRCPMTLHFRIPILGDYL